LEWISLKTWFGNLPIKHKLLMIGLISLGSALLLVSLALASLQFFSARQRLLQDTQVIARLLGENSGAALVFQDQKTASELLQSLHLHPEIIVATLYLPNLQPFATYHRTNHIDPLADASLEPLAGIEIQSGATSSPPSDTTPLELPPTLPTHHFSWRTMELFEWVSLPNQIQGVIGLRVSLAQRYQHLLEFLGTIALITLLALLAALWLLHYLQRMITQPLLELTHLMQTVSDRHDYTQRAVIVRHDEIGLLAQGFNAMLEVIEQRQTGLKRELRERENTNRNLNQLAHYDALTGLPNRYYFNEQLKLIVKSALARRERAGLMFIDLDGFKPVNDTLGHRIGDQLLRSVANRLTSCVRAGDSVCRIGGDEFAILLETLTDPHHAGIVAEKILQTLAEPFKLEGHTVQIGSSIGISLCPDDTDDSATLLHYADIAMYQAKQNGKGRYQYFHAKLHG
jgi:diguanylate cyclase (GGDEF)-like protein